MEAAQGPGTGNFSFQAKVRSLDETPRNAWCFDRFRDVSASVRQLQVQMPSEVLQIFSPSHVEMGCHLEGCKAGNGAVFANIFQFSI